MSIHEHASSVDEQIAEGIRELEDGPLADVKSYDHISFTQVIHVTKFDLNLLSMKQTNCAF